MLDSINHMTLKLLKNRIFGVKTSIFCYLSRNVIMDVITLRYQICKPFSGFSMLLHGVISLPDVTSCDKNLYIHFSL